MKCLHYVPFVFGIISLISLNTYTSFPFLVNVNNDKLTVDKRLEYRTTQNVSDVNLKLLSDSNKNVPVNKEAGDVINMNSSTFIPKPQYEVLSDHSNNVTFYEKIVNLDKSSISSSILEHRYDVSSDNKYNNNSTVSSVINPLKTLSTKNTGFMAKLLPSNTMMVKREQQDTHDASSVSTNVGSIIMLYKAKANNCTEARLAVRNQTHKTLCFPFEKAVNDFGTNIRRVITYTGVRGGNEMCTKYFQNTLCDNLPARTQNRSKNFNNSLVNITMSCDDIYRSEGFGTGNFMMTFYSIRHMARQIGNIDVALTCTDANATKDRLILPWLMGNFPRTYWYDHMAYDKESMVSFLNSSDPNTCGILHRLRVEPRWCKAYNPLHMYPDIIFELRRMAIALVGTVDSDHPSNDWAQQNLWDQDSRLVRIQNRKMQTPTPQRYDQPILKKINIDDVAFHFRCGDIMAAQNPHYGFMRFPSYTKRIHGIGQFRSIGIITQPFFGGGQGRKRDRRRGSADRCRKVIYAFKHYLEEQNYTYNTFDNNTGINTVSKVKVHIRNNANEYITTAYARIIMARHLVVASRSSFSRFAVMASFGQQTYLQSPGNEFNVSRVIPSLHQTNETILSSVECQNLWDMDNGDTVIQKFVSPD
jgi:hypothetical protein